MIQALLLILALLWPVHVGAQNIAPPSGFAAADIDTCAEFAAIMTGETGTCGNVVLSQAPTVDSPIITTKVNGPSATAFPGSPSVGDIVFITDDSVTNACDSNAGTAVSQCRWNGSAWVAVGNGSGPTVLTMIETAAPGAPTTATHYRFYYDSTLNALATHEQGGSARNYVHTAATMTAGRCVQVASGGGTEVEAASAPCGAGGTAGSPLFVQTATATAVTAAAETTILSTGVGSKTIPVNWFTAAGTVMDVRFSGKYSTGAVPGTLQIKLKFGATVVAQTVAFTPLTSVTDGIYSGFIRLIARTVGASGTIFVADGILTTGSTLTPGEIIFSNPTLGTAVTIDTTATQVVDITATWGTGATNSITGYTFEMVGPGSAVSSVFGRTGAVVAAANDYSVSQLSGLGTGVATALGVNNNSAGGYSPIDGAATLTNKTIDCTTAGNVCTFKQERLFEAAGCNNTTAGPVFNLPTTNAAVPACDTGTNQFSAYLGFNDTTDQSTHGSFRLPTGYTGGIDWLFRYKLASATTGTIGWCVQLVRLATGAAGDPAFPAQAAGNCVSTTVPGTAGFEQEATITNVTCTSCVAGDRVFWRVSRDADGGAVGDTATGDGRLIITGPAYAVAY